MDDKVDTLEFKGKMSSGFRKIETPTDTLSIEKEDCEFSKSDIR